MDTTKDITANYQALSLNTYKTWILAAAFVAGNLILPQLAHLMPQGGLILLPIYFFTLIAAYRYGVQLGILTAVASPLVNSLLFGMPAAAMLPIIIIKGILLAIAAGYAANHFKKVNLMILTTVVLTYQIVGCAIEIISCGSLYAGIQDFRIGYPGMLIQIVCGYVIIKWMESKA